MFPEAAHLVLAEGLVTAALGVRLFVAAVFVLAARHKLLNRLEFRGIVAQYRLVPDSTSALLGLVIPLTEIAAAVALLVAPLIGAVLAALLLCLYAGAIAVNLVRGRQHIDCGCGGESTPLSYALVGRNLFMAMMLMLVGFVETSVMPRALSAMGVYGVSLACSFAVALGAVYICFNQLQVNAGIYRRLWLGEQVG